MTLRDATQRDRFAFGAPEGTGRAGVTTTETSCTESAVSSGGALGGTPGISRARTKGMQ